MAPFWLICSGATKTGWMHFWKYAKDSFCPPAVVGLRTVGGLSSALPSPPQPARTQAASAASAATRPRCAIAPDAARFTASCIPNGSSWRSPCSRPSRRPARRRSGPTAPAGCGTVDGRSSSGLDGGSHAFETIVRVTL